MTKSVPSDSVTYARTGKDQKSNELGMSPMQERAYLYKPDAMPENLRAAHAHNDEVLERIYIGRHFKNDTERLEKLIAMHTKMTTKVDGKTNL